MLPYYTRPNRNNNFYTNRVKSEDVDRTGSMSQLYGSFSSGI